MGVADLPESNEARVNPLPGSHADETGRFILMILPPSSHVTIHSRTKIFSPHVSAGASKSETRILNKNSSTPEPTVESEPACTFANRLRTRRTQEDDGDMSTSASRVSGLQQVAGPSVAGMEKEAPTYHLDISSESIADLVRDPVSFLQEIGLGPEQGIAPDGVVSVHFAGSRKVWDGSKWRLPDHNLTGGRASGSCCYVTGEEMHCHVHEE